MTEKNPAAKPVLTGSFHLFRTVPFSHIFHHKKPGTWAHWVHWAPGPIQCTCLILFFLAASDIDVLQHLVLP
jgi:hypothetical protein